MKANIDFYLRMLADWPNGTLSAIIIGVVLLLVLAAVIVGLFMLADSSCTEKQKGVGKVVGKQFIPSHIDVTLISNAGSNTFMTYPIKQPEKWRVAVEINGRTDSITVGKEMYDTLTVGDYILTEFVIGRFFGALYLENIYVNTSV